MTAVEESRGTSGSRRERPTSTRGRAASAARQRRRGPAAAKLASTRAALTAWLSRPLASFHLLLAVFGLLTVIGLVMVLSATTVESYQQGASVYGLFKKQLMYVLLGLVAFWVVLRMPLRLFRRVAGGLLLLCLVLLAAVLVIGRSANGSMGWFTFGPVSFQPVELAKLGLALWGAHVLARKQTLLHQYRHLLVPVVPVALLMFALVMLQPDLGGTITLAMVLVGLLWFVGAPLRLFGALLVGGVAGVVVLAVGAKYRLARLLAFLHPGAHPQGASYQVRQALYALADGGIFGRGLGQGPSKWLYLPNLHNDFIFALIGEELGLVGAALVIGLFVALAVIGLRVAARNVDPWIKIVSGTLTVWIVAQATVNIGCVIGLLPVTGVTLPMISYGGTSIVTMSVVFGILANCARHEPDAVADLRSQGPGKFGKLLRLPAPPVYRAPARRAGQRVVTRTRAAVGSRAVSAVSTAGRQRGQARNSAAARGARSARGGTQRDRQRGRERGRPWPTR